MGEAETCVEVSSNGEVENGSSSRIEKKRDLECVVSDGELEACSPCKKQLKVASNDDVSSEVSDPTVSAVENESTLIRESNSVEPVELDRHVQVNSGDLTSTSSGNSSDVESRNDSCSAGISVSHFSLEIPEHVSSTGIRKITFKFSKSKEEYQSRLSTSMMMGQLPSDGLHEGGSPRDFHQESDCSSISRGLHKMELKMSKKVVPDGYPTNVKKLLSTGILEGARVKYITTSQKKEISGIIRGSGYLCGCVRCNYSSILSAYEFEQHAGGAKTRHPNNHIYLENGRPIYSIIEQLKTASPGMLEEVVKDIAGPSYNEGSYRVWRANLLHGRHAVRLDKMCEAKSPSLAQAHMRYIEEQQGKYTKPAAESTKWAPKRSNLSVPTMTGTQIKESGNKKRDNDLHRLLFMPNGLPDGAELAYCAKGQVILKGYKQGNGIVCSHCNSEISPSQFEAHAGWAARRQPYRHIYTSNGLTLHDIAVSLSNGQKLTTGHSDDMCTVCGDDQKGELTLCRGCPRAYHAACLGSDYIARDDDWSCPHCAHNTLVPGDSSTGTMMPIMIKLTGTGNKSEIEIGGCVICRANDFSSDEFGDRTVIICDQCEREYHVGCLRDSGFCDLKELPLGKWFCSGDCSRVHVAFLESVQEGPKAITSSILAALNSRLVERGLSRMADCDVRWQLISGKGRVKEHNPLLSGAAAIFRESFSPIVTSSGRDLIPVMVYGRNISGQEFSNMYTVILTVKSIIVSAALLRVFNREVAELPIAATTKENQAKGYFTVLLACIELFLTSLNVEKLILPATEGVVSIWVNKFGFEVMSEERVSKYSSEMTLTGFNGTVWMEKALKH